MRLGISGSLSGLGATFHFLCGLTTASRQFCSINYVKTSIIRIIGMNDVKRSPIFCRRFLRRWGQRENWLWLLRSWWTGQVLEAHLLLAAFQIKAGGVTSVPWLQVDHDVDAKLILG